MNLPDQLPIVADPSIHIIDGSKINDFHDCERKFFFAHALGWRPEHPNNDLVFGDAIHFGMAHIMKSWYLIMKNDDVLTAKIVLEAYDRFLYRYRQVFSSDMDEFNKPKTPEIVPLLYAEYIKRYRFEDKFEVLYTEVAGSVPIDFQDGNAITLSFRIDTICRDERGYFFLEHKTTKVASDWWAIQFKLSYQCFIYTHVIRSMFPDEKHKVWGGIVNGLVTKKTKTPDVEFMRVPVQRSDPMMNAWLLQARRRLNQIEGEFHALQHEKATDTAMVSFPMRPTSCNKFSGCEFLPYCTSWANPLAHQEPPLGFKREFWDPSHYEHDEDVYVQHLTEKKGAYTSGTSS